MKYAVPQACSILAVPYSPDLGFMMYNRKFLPLSVQATRETITATLAAAPPGVFQCGLNANALYIHENDINSRGKPVFVLETHTLEMAIRYYLMAKSRDDDPRGWGLWTEDQGLLPNNARCSELSGNNVVLVDRSTYVEEEDVIIVMHEEKRYKLKDLDPRVCVGELPFILGIEDPLNHRISTKDCVSLLSDTLVSSIRNVITIH